MTSSLGHATHKNTDAGSHERWGVGFYSVISHLVLEIWEAKERDRAKQHLTRWYTHTHNETRTRTLKRKNTRAHKLSFKPVKARQTATNRRVEYRVGHSPNEWRWPFTASRINPFFVALSLCPFIPVSSYSQPGLYLKHLTVCHINVDTRAKQLLRTRLLVTWSTRTLTLEQSACSLPSMQFTQHSFQTQSLIWIKKKTAGAKCQSWGLSNLSGNRFKVS